MLTAQDLRQIEERGISPERIYEQLKRFREGFPFLKLSATASVEKGILTPDIKETTAFISEWDTYRNESHNIVKFVPASGAASRMFKNMFAFLDAEYDSPQTDFEKAFFDGIHNFAFYNDLDEACTKIYNKNITSLLHEQRYKDIVRAMLTADGLNYGALPKGLLKFHYYPLEPRTPIEEHLVEGALYSADQNGLARLHFTVSPEHLSLFKARAQAKAAEIGVEYGVTFDLTFSVQKSSTDTLAVTPQNEPFRNDDGSLLFRPAGHGALIENLNDLDADIVFIKNIDNVVPDKYKTSTVRNKKLLAGILVNLQRQIFEYLNKLDSGAYSMDELRDMLQFIQKRLFCKNPSTKMLEDTELAIYVRRKLNRPIRVCGMVRNVGEPGGGPFLAYNPDGTISLQILESSQIDMNDAESKAMFEKGTHFNPVDLVCGIKDYRGQKFDLTRYVDPTTGFISHKSKNGRELKALELPGLWNGSMSDWNTVFVEVPLDTFNPVKTVNDLLREQHQ